MLRTRLWMGSILVLLTAGMLILDQRLNLGPWYPFLLLFFLALATPACLELLHFLPAEQQPPAWLCLGSVLAVLLANWPAHVWQRSAADPWHTVLGVFTAVVLLVFLVEMATFREPGGSVVRMALAVWVVAYLGLLPSFLAQLRWWPAAPGESSGDSAGVAAVALTIFVPKSCDIGAYFIGRLLGRHRMTPVLSPKKTWEGLAGGLVVSVLTAVVLNRQVPLLRGTYLEDWGFGSSSLAADLSAAGFGLATGLAGVLGDLAESLIKRDSGRKDASQVVPGFGGVLDVLDSILFAAPVAYWYFR